MSREPCDVMIALADYCVARQLHAPLHHHVDEQWEFAIAGKEKAKLNGIDLDPFHFAIWFNGWPAGVGDPFGGTICAGELANEQTFLEHGEIHVVIYACPTCHNMVQFVPCVPKHKAKIGGGK